MSPLALAARSLGATVVLSAILVSAITTSNAADQVVQPVVATSGFASMLQVLFGLGLVLAAIAGTAWLLKKLAPGQVAGSGAVRVVGGVAVGPKERVVLVDVGDTRLVLGVAPGHVSTLLEMPRPADENVTEQMGNASGFYVRLMEAMNSRIKPSTKSDQNDAQ